MIDLEDLINAVQATWKSAEKMYSFLLYHK